MKALLGSISGSSTDFFLRKQSTTSLWIQFYVNGFRFFFTQVGMVRGPLKVGAPSIMHKVQMASWTVVQHLVQTWNYKCKEFSPLLLSCK